MQIKPLSQMTTTDKALQLYKMIESAGNNGPFDLNMAWNYYQDIKKDLEILYILKKYIEYRPSFYQNQANWEEEKFYLSLKSDDNWLTDKEREILKSDFTKLKEGLL